MNDTALMSDIEIDDGLAHITKSVIGAAIEVHRLLGPGFLECVYEQALAVEMTERRIEFVRQAPMFVAYKGHCVGEGKLDFLVGRSVIVELKATESLAPIHTAQVISYLKATGLHLGLLINFNVRLLKDGIKRIAL